MDPISTVVFAALAGTAQGGAEGISSAVVSRLLREFFRTRHETYGELVGLLDDQATEEAGRIFETLYSTEPDFRDMVKRAYDEAKADGATEYPATGASTTATGGSMAIGQISGSSAVSTGSGSSTVTTHNTWRFERALPYVAIVGLVVLAVVSVTGFLYLQSSINRQNNSIGDITNSVNLVASDVGQLSTGLSDTQSRVAGVEGQINNQAPPTPVSPGTLPPQVGTNPGTLSLANTELVQGWWGTTGALSSREVDYPSGDAVSYSTRGTNSVVIKAGQPWVAVRGSFFSDSGQSSPGSLGRLQILDPNSSESLWTSQQLAPGDSQNFDVPVSGHAQIEFRLTSNNNYCLGGVAASMSQ